MVLKCETPAENEVRRQWLRAELEALGLVPQEADGSIYTIVRNAPGPIESRVIQLFLKCQSYAITRSE